MSRSSKKHFYIFRTQVGPGRTKMDQQDPKVDLSSVFYLTKTLKVVNIHQQAIHENCQSSIGKHWGRNKRDKQDKKTSIGLTFYNPVGIFSTGRPSRVHIEAPIRSLKVLRRKLWKIDRQKDRPTNKARYSSSEHLSSEPGAWQGRMCS